MPLDQQTVMMIDTQVREAVEDVWQEIVGEQLDDYRLLVWGSVANESDTAQSDLDIIVEYVDADISPDIENQIEETLHNRVSLREYHHLDPLVVQYLETPDIVANSTNDRVFSIDEDGWLEF